LFKAVGDMNHKLIVAGDGYAQADPDFHPA
jgi:hypothetical protein